MKVVKFIKNFLAFILSCVFAILLLLLITNLFSQNLFTEKNIDKIVNTEQILEIKQEGSDGRTIKNIIVTELSERQVDKEKTIELLKSEELDNLISDYVYDYAEYIFFSKERPIIKEQQLQNIFNEVKNEKNQNEVEEYIGILTDKINESTPSIYELENMGYDINTIKLGFSYIHSTEGLIILIASLMLVIILIGAIMWDAKKALKIASIPTIIIGLILTVISLMEVNFMDKIINNEGILDGMILMVVNESLKDLLTYGIILLALGIIIFIITTILIKKGKNKQETIIQEPVQNRVKENLKDHIATPEKEIEQIGEPSIHEGQEVIKEEKTSIVTSEELPKVTLPSQEIEKNIPNEKITNTNELPKIELEAIMKKMPEIEEVKAVTLNEIKKPEMELVETESLPKIEIPKEEPKEIEIVEIEKTHEIEPEEPKQVENPFAYVEINDEKEEPIIKKEVEIKAPESINLNVTTPIKTIENTKEVIKEDDVELL